MNCGVSPVLHMYMAEFIFVYIANCKLLVSTELSGGPPPTWIGVALASDDCCD